MRNNRIWILITDGVSARICSSSDGTTTAITAPIDLNSAAIEGPENKRISEAWYFSGGTSCLMSGAMSRFAGHIAQILAEAAAERAFDGLVIIAAPQIASAIDRVLGPQIRARMIGEIVRDLPPVAPVEMTAGEELWH
jgi:protein required for attachment to host cells